MGVTYTSARERERLRGRFGARLSRGQLVLSATSLVSLLAIVLCYLGRTTAEREPRAGPAPVNLTDVAKVEPLEAALAPAFDNVADRRFAAQELLRRLAGDDVH